MSGNNWYQAIIGGKAVSLRFGYCKILHDFDLTIYITSNCTKVTSKTLLCYVQIFLMYNLCNWSTYCAICIIKKAIDIVAP